MKISAQLVKELREKTSAGILDCKKALTECEGNFEKSISWLREKGIANANKKSDRIASEGIVNIATNKNIGVIYEVNTETDFVAKNDKFLKLIDIISNELLLNHNVKNINEVLNIKIKNKTLNDIIIENISIIGEKISLRRFKIFKLKNDQSFASYIHNQKTAALIVFNGKSYQTVGKQICMHIAAMSPQFISTSDVPKDFIEKETKILTKKALSEGKPKNIVEKMVKGRLNKSLAEICLLEQTFIVNPDLKVASVLKENNLTIDSMVRFEVGEGIEKITHDFVTEVMKQVKNKE